jgi:hypothetical protein
MPTPLDIPDKLKCAFRRIALSSNPHWVSYYSSDKTPGRNDLQASVGHITSNGKDLRRRASKPYWFSQQVIDERKLGFGFWSRSGPGDDGRYRFACYDIEPIDRDGVKRVIRSPTPGQCQRTRDEAERAYGAWTRLAEERQEIIWVLLVESSPHHYHVWALFERPATRAEHHALVEQARRLHGPLQNLDKDTTRGEGRFGDQFRSPWTWKKGRRSEALASRIRSGDEDLVIRLGEEARPGDCHRVDPSCKDLADKPDVETLLAYAIANHPLQPGTRDIQQRDLIATLLYKRVPEDTIREVGRRWLRHFEGCYGVPLGRAVSLFKGCLDRTLANPKFVELDPTDYTEAVRSAAFTPSQKLMLTSPSRDLTVATVQSQAADSPEQSNAGCLPLLGRVRGDTSAADPSPGAEGRDHGPLCTTEQEEQFVEALVVMAGIELSKGRAGRKIRFTRKQIIEAILLRHPDFPPLQPRQYQRIKDRYVTHAGRGGLKRASRCELLVESLKGVTGVASEYVPTPAMLALLDPPAGPAGVAEMPQARPTASEARPCALGPGPAQEAAPAREPRTRARKATTKAAAVPPAPELSPPTARGVDAAGGIAVP